ncbi:MAG: DUF87 domain-containing protein [Sulfurovaceae bacterium]|nr:DUF87 domain-containing protein [Sulfurovaceae bacterium]
MSKDIYEKLDLFYLGKDFDKATLQSTNELTLIKNKAFTTHATIIGMTGSGKTGLGVGLIEEASLDNILSIVIDPKGDMGNLCLVDSTFNPTSFEGWVKDEAVSKGKDPIEYSKEVAQNWLNGIEGSDQDKERVNRFQSVEKTIYTPGSTAGVGVNILSSLEVPDAQVLEDMDTYMSYLKTTTSSLLSLVSIEDDSGSKEYVLLSSIISNSWKNGENVSLETIIANIINPTFDKIGILPVEDFFESKSRFDFASKFNALLASPSFALWLQGENIDIDKLLYDQNGKAKIAIFNISHLDDNQRMFFVSLLLNRYIAWMRRQSGTEVLKTILYMDEIFGFFPPSKNPPSKEPMLLLLKQGRAFGVGVILSTQNPVDLDYKGLSNMGTWFIGRLQTSQDINKVIDGLSGQIGSSFSKEEIEKLLLNLPKRTFLLKSIHLEDVKLFGTRWTMSYLKGPLKKEEIIALSVGKKSNSPTIKEPSTTVVKKTLSPVDSSISQYFETGANDFVPTIGAKGTILFFNQAKGINENKDLVLNVSIDENSSHIDTSNIAIDNADFTRFQTTPPNSSSFEAVPDFVRKDKSLKDAQKQLTDYIYQTQNIELFVCKSLKLESAPNESKTDFIIKVNDAIRAKKDEQIEKLTQELKKKEESLNNKKETLNYQLDKEKSESTASWLNAGVAVLGALLSGGSSASKVGKVVSQGGRVLRENGDKSRIEDKMDQLDEDLKLLDDDFKNKVDELDSIFKIENYPIETLLVKPKKSDINISTVALVWRRA